MSHPDTMTLSVPPETAAKLRRLADDRGREAEDLAAAALSSFADHELAIADLIRQGLADLEAGHVVPHDAAMDEIDALIEAAAKRRP